MKKRFNRYSFILLALVLFTACVSAAYFVSLLIEGVTFYSALPGVVIGILIALLVGVVYLRISCKIFVRPISHLKTRTAAAVEQTPIQPHTPAGAKDIDFIDESVYTLATRNHLNEQLLGRETDKLLHLQENMRDGLLILNSDGRITDINKTAKAFFKKEYYAGCYISDYTTSTTLLTSIDQVFATSKGLDYETNSDGSTFLVRIAPLNLYSPLKQQQEMFVCVYLHDITAISQNAAIRSEFFTNASHELKTPLTSIIGFGDLLTSDMVLSEDKRIEYEHRMVTEARSMASLIDDILDISALENQPSHIDTASVNLMEIAHTVADTLSLKIQSRNLDLFFYGDNAIFDARIGHMEQLIKNLLENAILYNRENGKVEITILDKKDYIFLRVSDTGIGIPKEHQSRIFERFYRVDKGRSRSLGGTGLGLAIVKRIALHYGGTIELKSTEGVGTEIEIELQRHTY